MDKLFAQIIFLKCSKRGLRKRKILHAVTPHELRHSFVALAIAAGVPLYEISQALGHSDIGITSRVYAHMIDNTHSNATESMAQLLREKD